MRAPEWSALSVGQKADLKACGIADPHEFRRFYRKDPVSAEEILGREQRRRDNT